MPKKTIVEGRPLAEDIAADVSAPLEVYLRSVLFIACIDWWQMVLAGVIEEAVAPHSE